MENPTEIPNINPLIVTDEIKSFLKETAKWMRFLAILGFIGLGLILIAAVMIFLAGLSASEYGPQNLEFVALGYVLMAIIYYFPIDYLYKSGMYLKHGIEQNRQDLITKGFQHMKSHYKFIGITTIVVLSIYAMVILFVLIVQQVNY